MPVKSRTHYRMYIRTGGQARWSTEGKNLMLTNTALAVYRGRFGGRPALGAAICKMTDADIVD